MATVLCVSHEWNLSLDTVRALTDAGHSLLTANNAYAALRQFASHPVDAVIVDRRLPDLDVQSLASCFKNHNPELPVIMVAVSMPPPGARPDSVDVVISKSHCVDLLVPTLELLIRTPGRLEEARTPPAVSPHSSERAA